MWSHLLLRRLFLCLAMMRVDLWGQKKFATMVGDGPIADPKHVGDMLDSAARVFRAGSQCVRGVWSRVRDDSRGDYLAGWNATDPYFASDVGKALVYLANVLAARLTTLEFEEFEGVDIHRDYGNIMDPNAVTRMTCGYYQKFPRKD